MSTPVPAVYTQTAAPNGFAPWAAPTQVAAAAPATPTAPATPSRSSLLPKLESDAFIGPLPQKLDRIRLRDAIRHPRETWALRKAMGTNLTSGESIRQRLTQFNAIYKALSPTGQEALKRQLTAGRLTEHSAEDGRTGLSNLYDILTTPRAEGLEAVPIIEDVLRLLETPDEITQKFAEMAPPYLGALKSLYTRVYGQDFVNQLDFNLIRRASSATCAASSKMSDIVERSPGEFVRHVNGLTSPRLTFYEKASAADLSPDDPTQAAQVMRDYGIQGYLDPGSPDTYRIKFELPQSGFIRALNQKDHHTTRVRRLAALEEQARKQGLPFDPADYAEPPTQSVVESMYQGVLTHTIARTYDPGLDARINPDKTLDPNKGIEEDRVALLVSILNDKTPAKSVTYQFTAVDSNYEPYLVGYFRNFEQTTNDLVHALDTGESVVIGITDTERDSNSAGRINMGHELRVKGYEKDPQTGEVVFIIPDSDDNVQTVVKRRASELVPKIHHAAFPLQIARRINQEMDATVQQQYPGMDPSQAKPYLSPDAGDAQRYQLIATVPPQMQPAFLENFTRLMNAENAQQTAQQVAQAPNAYPYAQYAQAAMQQAYPQAMQNAVAYAAPTMQPAYQSYPGSYYPMPQQQQRAYPASWGGRPASAYWPMQQTV